MPKFSESPFFVLKNFFTRKDIDGSSYLLPTYNQLPTSACSLRGQNEGITVLGGYGTNLYIFTSTGYYRLKGLYKPSLEDSLTSKFYSREDINDTYEGSGKNNTFVFELVPSSGYFGSEFSIERLFLESDYGNFSGSEVYLRKGDPFYDYLISLGFDSFINVNKQFLYFGKLYRGREDNEIYIYSDHFKDYVYRALPVHNRSENYDEFLGVAFDQLFQPIYNKIKNLFTLSDPYEVNEKYLMYLLESYDMPSLNDTTLERRYISRLVSMLKRKGTYTQFYLIWELLTKTINRLNVYERWHIPLENNVVPYPYFEDHLYTKNRLYYEVPISAGAGRRYYRTIYPCDIFDNYYYGIDVPYPVYGYTDYPYTVDTIFSLLSAISMEFEFLYEQDPWIISHNTGYLYITVQTWSNDENLVPKESTLLNSLQHRIDWSVPVSGYADVVFSEYTHIQGVPEKTWTVYHSLDTFFPIVTVLNRYYQKIIPDSITSIDQNTMIFDFGNRKVDGYALFTKPDYVYSQEDSTTTWEIDHNLGCESVVLTVYDQNFQVVYPNSITRSYDHLSIGWNPNWSQGSPHQYGSVAVKKVITKPNYWTLNHNLPVHKAMIQCWNENLYNIYKEEFIDGIYFSTLINSPSSTTATFSEYIPGYMFAAEADYFHSNGSDTTWSVKHDLDEKYCVVTVLDSEFNNITPSSYTLTAVDNNNLTIEFSSALAGYALVGKPDQVYFQTETSASWLVEHYQYTDFNLITCYSVEDDVSYIPSASRHIKWSNRIAIEWPTPSAGFVAIKGAKYAEEYLERVHNLGKTLSPHIKIEMDLSTEPLGPYTYSDFIINKSIIDKLQLLWEKLRPISRVYHYGIVIGSPADFSGSTSNLYEYGNVRYATRCLIEPNLPIPGCYVYYQPTLTKIINIFHNFSSENVIIQCFDTNNEMVEPFSTEIRSSNTVRVTFARDFSGYVCLSVADTTSDLFSPSSSEWTVSDVTYSSGYDQIIQITEDDTYFPKIVPASAGIVSANPVIYFSPSEASGYFIAVSASVYNFTVPSGGSVNIMHNLNGAAFQVQVFDLDNQMIYPDKIKVLNKDYLNISFGDRNIPSAGYCVIKKMANDIFRGGYTFGYAKVGYGISSQAYNPVLTNSLQSPYDDVFTILDRDIDEDDDYYYLTIYIDENLDYSVNEENNKYGIKEIGIYNNEGNILFYTYCGLIEKPVGVYLKLYYKIKKRL